VTPVALFELVLVLLGAALLISLFAGRIGVPPAVALVIGGMALALIPRVPSVDLDPDLIMVLFLPPLLLASAYFTIWHDFRAMLRPILMLSIGAVAFTTLCVGVVAHLVAPTLPWAACFALGAIVSPPDAVAAKAVLQRLALPRRMLTVLEGESLVNDASGLVLYRFAVAAALTGSFSVVEASASFVWLSVGGIALGLLVGLAVIAVAKRLSDSRMLIVTSFLSSWVSYILAEHVEASGVLAVVACGLLVGSKEHETFSAQTRIQAEAVWELVVFVLEALVFVLIGLALRGVLHRLGGDSHALATELPLALAISATVVVSRFLWVFPSIYLSSLLSRVFRAEKGQVPFAIPMIISWAGMRGVVSLAAALALPIGFPGRDTILLASFVVILFTVLVQGTTLGPLIVALRLEVKPTTFVEPLDVPAARVLIVEAAIVALEAMIAPDTKEPLHPKLTEEYRRRLRAATFVRDQGAGLETRRHDHFTAALIALQTARGELLRLHRERQIHVSVLRALEGELDFEELKLNRIVGGRTG
jgi:Na+/H+ antiporter